jgi:hypothetical protein
MRALAAALFAVLAASAAYACDYPGPPPGAGEARAGGRGILWAAFSDATTRYDHGILGDALEAGGLRAATATRGPCELAVILPESRVFEDVAPRLADLDGDGAAEIVVVETDVDKGASVAVYGLRRGRLVRLAATPPIGQTHRWLAPAAIGDLDGDGRVEIAYVDRPHLARILRVVRYVPEGPRLTPIAEAPGHTNHRIGDREILGGLRTCAGAPEIVTATPDWSRLQATSLVSGRLVTRDIGRNRGPRAVARALACR